MRASEPAGEILSEAKDQATSDREQTHDGWAHQDSNLGPTDYESAALTN